MLFKGPILAKSNLARNMQNSMANQAFPSNNLKKSTSKQQIISHMELEIQKILKKVKSKENKSKREPNIENNEN